jgi:hypothetical protein
MRFIQFKIYLSICLSLSIYVCVPVAIYCFGFPVRVAFWHSSVFRYTYSINKRNVIIKATPWLLLYYPLAKRWVYSIRNSCPSVRSFVRPFDRIDILNLLSVFEGSTHNSDHQLKLQSPYLSQQIDCIGTRFYTFVIVFTRMLIVVQ